MTTIIFIVALVILLAFLVALQSAILFVLLVLFQFERPMYRRAVFIVFLLAFLQLALFLFLLIVPSSFIIDLLGILIPLVLFHLILKKYYRSVWWRSLSVYVLLIVCFGIFSFLLTRSIRDYIVEPFYVRGAAMEPTFSNRDYLFIRKFGKNFERGDIVVFRYPRDERQFFVKRIVGLPNEKIDIKEGKVFINDQPLSESYLRGQITGGNFAILLASDSFFILGDNRDASLDSRSFGPVSRRDIVGEIFLRLPSSQWEFLENWVKKMEKKMGSATIES